MVAHTPLYEAHRLLGPRWTEFGGWEMPLSYRSIAEEHRAVREHCGLFDVSHMGEIELSGPRAGAACQALTVNDVQRLAVGEGQYTLLCNDQGGVLDDLIVFRMGDQRYLLVVNAANAPGDLAWIRERALGDPEIRDRSAELALLAFQGPDAEVALRALTPLDLSMLRPFARMEGLVAGLPVVVCRTGYTGEDGFELLVDAGAARELWNALLEATTRREGLPCGLGARDTLRLEAGLPLHGSDMDASTTPLEAGLAWVVKLGKGDFIGRPALAAQAEAGVERRLVGIQLDEPGIPRHGYALRWNGVRVGSITSGTRSPTLGSFIGLGYVAAGAAAPGTPLEVDVRGRFLPARVVARPFYRRVQREKR